MKIKVGTKIKVTDTPYTGGVPNGSIMTVTLYFGGGNVEATLDGVGDFVWFMEVGTYEVLDDDTPQSGTLAELDVKVGDVVELVKYGSSGRKNETPPQGNRFKVDKSLGASPITHNHLGIYTSGYSATFRIVSRATDTQAAQPTLWRDMTPEQKGALLLAKHEGKGIEWYRSLSSTWEPDDNFDPIEHQRLAYRIAPHKPVVDTVGIYYEYGSDAYTTEYRLGDTHRITFNTIDGVPDCNSVKMAPLT